MVKVSVIVPVYNCEKYLRECLDSLVQQTLKDIEIICINDGSTDNSLQILEEYGKKYKNVFVFDQPDIGQAKTVNRGIRIANGEYIAECDADDFAEPTMYEELYNTAKRFDSDAVKCNFISFDDKTRSERKTEQVPWIFCNNPMNLDKLDGIKKQILVCRVPSIFAGIYKTDFIRKNGLYYREGHNYEDTSLSFRISAKAHNFVFVDVFLYHYRENREGSGTNTIKDMFAICEQFDAMERFSKANKLDAELCVNSQRYRGYMWMLGRLKTEQDRKRFIARCMIDFKLHPSRKEYFSAEEWELYEMLRG